MTIHDAPTCPLDARHAVRRYEPARPPPSAIRVRTGQGDGVLRRLDTEPPPWWCDRCGLQVSG